MLDLPPLLIDKLKAHKAGQAAKQLAAGADWKNEHAMVFTTTDGASITGAMMTKAWDDVLVEAKLPKKRLHDARHGAGTALLDLGVDLKVISAFLGHSTIQMPADTYLHTRRAVLGDAVAKLDALYK